MSRLLPIRFAVTVAIAAAGVFSLAGPAAAATPPTPDRGSAIETFAPYQPQTFCQPTLRPGTAALEQILTSTYAGTSIVSDVRPCGSDTSEHYDGRALDWGVSVFNATQTAQGNAFLAWLFATDKYGNKYAMARRLGVMYVIWNKQIWGAWNQAWAPYSCSGITACHQDHMHISLDWSAAYKKTSYWSGVVTSYYPPPLPSYDSLTSAETFNVYSTTSKPVYPMWNVVGGHTYRITARGWYHYSTSATTVNDAECTLKGSWMVWGTNLQVPMVSKWTPTTNTGSGCDPSHHTFSAIIKPSLTQELSFVIKDSTYTDNSGWLAITVQRIA